MARWQATGLHHGRAFQPPPTVPAAGIEPAPSRLQRDARPSSCTGNSSTRASGGDRTHTVRLTRAVLDHPSIAGDSDRVAGGSRTHTTPVHSRVPLPLWVRPQYPRQESNLHNLRLRRAACLRHTPGISFDCEFRIADCGLNRRPFSIRNPQSPIRNSITSARIRTRNSTFEASHDVRFTTEVRRRSFAERTTTFTKLRVMESNHPFRVQSPALEPLNQPASTK